MISKRLNWQDKLTGRRCSELKRISMKRGFYTLLAGALCLCLSACANLIRPNYSQELVDLRSGAYTLDPEHAYVNFRIGHLGLSTIVGRFNVVAGSLDFDPENITGLSLQGIIESASVDVNNAELEDTLRESAWFDTTSFPQITFTSTSVQRVDDNTVNIVGDLTLRGVTKEIVVKTRFNGGADNFLTGKYTLGFSANSTIARSDYGMDSFAALVANDVDIEMHGEFQRN